MTPQRQPLERWEQHALISYARQNGFGPARRMALILQAQRMAQFVRFIQRNVPVLNTGARNQITGSLEQRLFALFEE